MKTFLTIWLTVISLSIYSQVPNEDKRDSIRAVLRVQPDDTNKVLTWISFARTYNYNSVALGIPAVDSALKLATKLNWPNGIARASRQMGDMVGDTGNNVASNELFLTAIRIDEKRGDLRRVAQGLAQLARAYNRESDFPNALKTGLRAVDIAESLHDDSLIASTIGNIVITYLNHKNYVKGTEWALRAKELAERSGSDGDKVDALQHLAYIRTHEKNKAESRVLLRQALRIAKTMNEPVTVADVLSQLGEAEIDSPDVALPHLYAARKINQEFNPTSMRLASTLTLLGKVLEHTAMKKSGAEQRLLLDSAIAAEQQALKILLASKNRQYVSDVYEFLARFENEIGNDMAAYDYDMKSDVIYDSLFSQKKKSELAALQSSHDIEMKDKEIALRRLEAEDRKRLMLGLLGGVFLLAVIGTLLLQQNRQRKKTNTTLLQLNTELDEANKIKARFFGILSHDLRSPVANLLSFLDLVKNEPDSISAAEKADHQQQIGRSAEELLETMEAMLLWSKEQMDSFRPDWKQIPVADLFDYLQKFFYQERSVKISFVNEDNLIVSGDENYLRVIMQNLMSNALKVLKNNPAGLIEWKAVKSGNRTLLSITDNGSGLNSEQTKALYTDVAMANARTGFGFHLIRDLAKAIRYNISVDSVPGRGTTFVLQS